MHQESPATQDVRARPRGLCFRPCGGGGWVRRAWDPHSRSDATTGLKAPWTWPLAPVSCPQPPHCRQGLLLGLLWEVKASDEAAPHAPGAPRPQSPGPPSPGSAPRERGTNGVGGAGGRPAGPSRPPTGEHAGSCPSSAPLSQAPGGAW